MGASREIAPVEGDPPPALQGVGRWILRIRSLDVAAVRTARNVSGKATINEELHAVDTRIGLGGKGPAADDRNAGDRASLWTLPRSHNLGGIDDTVERPCVVSVIELSCLVFPKSRDWRPGVEEFGSRPIPTTIGGRSPDPPRAEVAIDVRARQLRNLCPSVAVSPYDRASSGTVRFMVIFEDWQRQGAVVAVGGRIKAVRPLHASPPVILPSPTASGREVYFLPRILADVANEQIASKSIEAESPGIAQAQRPHLWPCPRSPNKRIRGWDGVGKLTVHIEPEQLAQQRAEVLCIYFAGRRLRPVAHANVEVAVGAELQLAAVVIAEGLGDSEQHSARQRVGHVGIARHGIAREDGIAGRVRVVDVEESVSAIVRMKGDTEQAPFVATGDERGDIKEGRRQELSAVVDDNLSPLESKEETA